MKKVEIMRGCSGAGKSTYIRMHFPNAYVVSADQFFMQDGHYNFDGAKLSQAHQDCFRRFMEAIMIDELEHVVVDNTNTQAWELAPYVQGASSFGYEVEIHTLVVDPEIAAKRNLHGVRLRDVKRHAENVKRAWLPPWWPNNKIEPPVMSKDMLGKALGNR